VKVGNANLSLSNFNWVTGGFIIAYHLALAIGLPFYFYYNTPSVGLIVASAVVLFFTQLGIGGAYHRFYAHRGYTLRKPAEAVLLFLATLATQGPALRWSSEHRRHHVFVDTDDDPYSIKKGFWYAHVLWMFEKCGPLDTKRIPDLYRNKLVMFQNRYYLWLMLASNALVFVLMGWALGDFLGAFVIGWWTRLLISHHLTWFVNSLAHMWGERTYCKELSAVDNCILAFLTVGEGYHNYHHTFAADYRNGVRWYHFDPTKWTIWTLSKLGLAGNLRRFNRYTIRKRLITEDRRLLLETLKQQAHNKKLELEQKVEQLAECMRQKLNRISALADEVKAMKKTQAAARKLAAARSELKALKVSLREDFKSWSRLCGAVLEPHGV